MGQWWKEMLSEWFVEENRMELWSLCKHLCSGICYIFLFFFFWNIRMLLRENSLIANYLWTLTLQYHSMTHNCVNYEQILSLIYGEVDDGL